MANSILSSLLSKASFRIKDTTTNVSVGVARGLKVRQVTIRYSSTTMKHRREDGATLVDARIIQPTEVTVEAIAPTLDVVAQVNNVTQSRQSVYEITTKGLVLPWMRVDSQKVKQSGEMLSAAPVSLHFKQMLIQGKPPIVFAQGADTSLFDRGYQILQDAADTVTGIADKVKGIF